MNQSAQKIGSHKSNFVLNCRDFGFPYCSYVAAPQSPAQALQLLKMNRGKKLKEKRSLKKSSTGSSQMGGRWFLRIRMNNVTKTTQKKQQIHVGMKWGRNNSVLQWKPEDSLDFVFQNLHELLCSKDLKIIKIV